MRRWLLVVLIALSSGLPFGLAEAFEVAPAIQEIQIQAGTAAERNIRLMNPGDEPIEVFFTVQKFRAGGGGAPEFLPSEDIRGLPEWIRVSAPRAHLPPRSSAEVRVRIDVPTTAPSGGYTAAVFVTEASSDGAAVEVAKRIATLWFVTVQGSDGVTAKPAWKIDSLTVETHSKEVRAGAEARVSIRNTGNAHGVVVAHFQFDGLFMRPTSTYGVARLLPGETRQVSVTNYSLLPIDYWSVVVELPTGERIERRIWLFQPWFLLVCIAFMTGGIGAWRWRKRSNQGILAG